MNSGFAGKVLNALTAHIAVLDARGSIVAVNDAWKRFSHQNGGDGEEQYIGANYLAVCEDAVRLGGDEAAEAVLIGIRDLLNGSRATFSIEYPCHSRDVRRWFVARISRFEHEGGTFLLIAHENVTLRKEAEDRLRESDNRLRNVLDALPVGVWILDRSGRIVHGNPASRRIWAGARYVGPDRFGEYKGWWLDSGHRIGAAEWPEVRAIRKGETSTDEEIRIECFDGSEKIILNSAIPLRDGAGNIVGAVSVNQDITSRKASETELRRAKEAIDAMNEDLHRALAREQFKANTDELTGLSNRRHFHDLSGKLFSMARRYGTPLSVLIFDIDDFKRINDRYGHHCGDAILKRVARTVREHTRDADVSARYGGEEFIVALPNTTADEAFAAAEHLREDIDMSRDIVGASDMSVTISVGVAEMMPDEDTLEHLIQRADQALYAAKAAGRNCSRVFSPASGGREGGATTS